MLSKEKIALVYIVSLLLGGILYSYTPFAPLITVALGTLFLFMQKGQQMQIAQEGFKGAPEDTNQTGTEGTPLTLPFQDETTPGNRNPFENITLDELPDGHRPFTQRPAAADITMPERKVALDDFFRVNWYNDPTDVFGKTQSQRMFITQPSTTIPNDQKSYQDWLYKIPGKTCKEGNPAACYAGTEGAPVPWLNI